MIMEILLTVWLSLSFLGGIFVLTGSLIDEYKIGEVLLFIGHIIAISLGASTLLFIFVFSIYVVWS